MLLVCVMLCFIDGVKACPLALRMPSLRLTHSRVYKAKRTTPPNVGERGPMCRTRSNREDSCTIFLGTRRLAFELLPPGPFGSTWASALLGEVVSIRGGFVAASDS